MLHLQSLLKLESTPFTQNSHYLSEKTAKTLARFKDARSGKDVMMDEIRRFKARKQTGAPSKRPQDTSASVASANPFDLTSTRSLQPSGGFGAFSGAWSSHQSLTSPTTSAENTPKAAENTPKSASGRRRSNTAKGEVSAPSSSSTTQASSSAAATRPSASLFASVAHTQVTTTTVPFLAEENAAERAMLEIEALALLAKLGYTGLNADDLGKLNPPDEFEEELQVMAEVRAYFHVAYKASPAASSKIRLVANLSSAQRIIDYAPLSIDHLFLYGLSERLQDTLIEKLGLGSARSTERCTAYLSEDPGVVAARDELMGKRDRLESVQKELDNFMYT